MILETPQGESKFDSNSMGNEVDFGEESVEQAVGDQLSRLCAINHAPVVKVKVVGRCK